MSGTVGDAVGAGAEVASGRWDSMLDQIVTRAQRSTDRKQDRSKRTEQQILNAALRIFARDGISRSRIADIAAEAGISTSTLYEYYRSKEDLAYEVPSYHLATFFEGYRTAAADRPGVIERLQLYLTMSADFAREHADWARLFYLEIWPSVFITTTDVRHSVDDFARVALFLVREGMASGELSPTSDAHQTAGMLIGSVNQTIITWLLYRRPRNLTRASHEVAERLLRMLVDEAKRDRAA